MVIFHSYGTVYQLKWRIQLVKHHFCSFCRVPFGNLLHSELENHHAINGKINELNGPFSIAM